MDRGSLCSQGRLCRRGDFTFCKANSLHAHVRIILQSKTSLVLQTSLSYNENFTYNQKWSKLRLWSWFHQWSCIAGERYAVNLLHSDTQVRIQKHTKLSVRKLRTCVCTPKINFLWTFFKNLALKFIFECAITTYGNWLFGQFVNH